MRTQRLTITRLERERDDLTTALFKKYEREEELQAALATAETRLAEHVAREKGQS